MGWAGEEAGADAVDVEVDVEDDASVMLSLLDEAAVAVFLSLRMQPRW